MDQQIFFQEKFKKITQNKHLFDNNLLKCLNELKVFQERKDIWKQQSPLKPDKYAKCVKLQTFYKCCMPAYYSLKWQEEINYKTANPIAGVLAFIQQGEDYHLVDQKFTNWVQSGGTKVIPIKADVSEEKLDNLINNIHSLIIPQFKVPPKTDIFKLIARKIQENRQLPVLAFGGSAIFLMSALHLSQDIKNYCQFPTKLSLNSQINVFASHDDPFFADLNVKTRLQIENMMKIKPTQVNISVQKFASQKYEQIKVLGVIQNKQEWFLLMAKQKLVYYCFVSPQKSALNNEAVAFYHKIIINFLQQVRKGTKVVEQKFPELGQYKMMLKDDRYVYNCDVKLAKP